MNRFPAPITSRSVTTTVENDVVLQGIFTTVVYATETDTLSFEYAERTQDGYTQSVTAVCFLNGKQIAVSTGYGILASQFTYARN